MTVDGAHPVTGCAPSLVLTLPRPAPAPYAGDVPSSLDLPAPAWGLPEAPRPVPGPTDARTDEQRRRRAVARRRPTSRTAAGRPTQTVVPRTTWLDRSLATVAHLVPVFALGFLAPLGVWLLARGRGPFVEQHARESLNMQLTLLGGYVVAWLLVVQSWWFLALVGAVWLAQVGLGVVATAAAARGELYRYPVSLRLVR